MIRPLNTLASLIPQTIIIIIFSLQYTFTQNHENPSADYRKILAADAETYGIKVLLEWQIDLDREVIIFDITARTTGYVGFGLKRPSKSANRTEVENHEGMYDTDIVIGGIYPNGSSYLIVLYF